MTKVVLFDLWGTIIENGIFPSPVKQVKYIMRLNIPFGEYIHKFEQSFMTREFENLTEAFKEVCKAFDKNPPGFVIDRLVGMWNKNSLLSKPFPDTIETFEMLQSKGVKICLIANTDKSSVNQVLDKFDLRKYFDEFVLSYDLGMLKSNPELFEIAAKKFGVDKKDMLMVGDSIESDIKSAENAGVPAVLVDRKDRRELENKVVSLKDIETFMG